jgi:hypothetical protein
MYDLQDKNVLCEIFGRFRSFIWKSTWSDRGKFFVHLIWLHIHEHICGCWFSLILDRQLYRERIYWIIMVDTLLEGGTRWRSWLRHCATSRKIAGSVPDCVTGIFHWHNPSGRTMALGLTQPLREMSKVKQSHYRPWQTQRVAGVRGSKILRQSAHEGGKEQKWVPGIITVGKGGRCVGLTILSPSCADCLEIWEPGTPWACPGL